MAGWSPLLFVARRAPASSFSSTSLDDYLDIHSTLAGSNPIEMRTSLSDIVGAWCRDCTGTGVKSNVQSQLTRLVHNH